MASTNNIPQELNWVELRAACSAERLFVELQSGIENDVAAINRVGNVEPDSQYRFMAQATTDGRVFVVRQAGGGPRVKLGVHKGRIFVEDEATPSKWSARVTFSNEGRCRLKLDEGDEIEQWQFRKMALHNLFFDKETE